MSTRRTAIPSRRRVKDAGATSTAAGGASPLPDVGPRGLITPGTVHQATTRLPVPRAGSGGLPRPNKQKSGNSALKSAPAGTLLSVHEYKTPANAADAPIALTTHGRLKQPPPGTDRMSPVRAPDSRRTASKSLKENAAISSARPGPQTNKVASARATSRALSSPFHSQPGSAPGSPQLASKKARTLSDATADLDSVQLDAPAPRCRLLSGPSPSLPLLLDDVSAEKWLLPPRVLGDRSSPFTKDYVPAATPIPLGLLDVSLGSPEFADPGPSRTSTPLAAHSVSTSLAVPLSKTIRTRSGTIRPAPEYQPPSAPDSAKSDAPKPESKPNLKPKRANTHPALRSVARPMPAAVRARVREIAQQSFDGRDADADPLAIDGRGWNYDGYW